MHAPAVNTFVAPTQADGGSLDRNAIAARLRGLIGGQHQGDLGAVAARLGVDEVSLRMSIDTLAPYPTLDVLSAVVTLYGVDPTWLISGDYNSGTHRAVENDPGRTLEEMRQMMGASQLPPTGAQPAEPPALRLLKDA